MNAIKGSMGSLAKLFACCIPLALMIALAGAGTAFADGNQSMEVVESGSDDVSIQFGNDAIWAGLETTFKDASFDNDLLAAGQTINVKDSKVKGSIRAAGQYVQVSDCAVDQNVTIAGETVSIDGGTVNCAALAGATASFSGECNSLAVTAGTVRIDGIVYGDVMVDCDTVEIGPNAVIEGTLEGDTGSAPEIATGAKVASNSVTIKADESKESGSSNGLKPLLGGLAASASIIAILSLVTFILVAMLCEWLARKHTAGAAMMIRQNTAGIIVSGLVGMLIAIPAIVLLCVLVVTLPIAGVIGLVLVAIGLVGANFMAASLSGLAFPKMSRMKRVALFALILGVAKLIPILGGLVGVAGFVYLLGYVIQRIWIGMRETSAPASAPQPPLTDQGPVHP